MPGGTTQPPLVGIDASRTTVRPRTGTEAYSYHLIRHLVGAERAYRYRLYFNRPPDPDDASYLGTFADCRTIPSPRLWTHIRLSAEMVTRPPDVLFVPSHVLPIVRPRRCIATVHDLGYLYWPQTHPLRRRLYLDVSTRFNARAATLVIADSAATQRDLVLRYGTPAERIRVVHLGAGDEYRPQSPDRTMIVRARYGLPARYVLAVGTIHPRKNLVRLLDAFASIRARVGPEVGLVFVGRAGWDAATVYERARALGGAATFLDYADAADMPALYSGAAALAFVSLYEGFGLPALEAMACGVPVIAADSSSLPEVVGEAGLLVPPTDTRAIASALVAVLTDDALSARLIAAGRRRAAHFTWDRCAAGVAAVLAEVLVASK